MLRFPLALAVLALALSTCSAPAPAPEVPVYYLVSHNEKGKSSEFVRKGQLVELSDSFLTVHTVTGDGAQVRYPVEGREVVVGSRERWAIVDTVADRLIFDDGLDYNRYYAERLPRMEFDRDELIERLTGAEWQSSPDQVGTLTSSTCRYAFDYLSDGGSQQPLNVYCERTITFPSGPNLPDDFPTGSIQSREHSSGAAWELQDRYGVPLLIRWENGHPRISPITISGDTLTLGTNGSVLSAAAAGHRVQLTAAEPLVGDWPALRTRLRTEGLRARVAVDTQAYNSPGKISRTRSPENLLPDLFVDQGEVDQLAFELDEQGYVLSGASGQLATAPATLHARLPYLVVQTEQGTTYWPFAQDSVGAVRLTFPVNVGLEYRDYRYLVLGEERVEASVFYRRGVGVVGVE